MRRWARVGGLKDESSTYKTSGGVRWEWSEGIEVRTSKFRDDVMKRRSVELYCARRVWNEGDAILRRMPIARLNEIEG